jgi:hypothetical protein
MSALFTWSKSALKRALHKKLYVSGIVLPVQNQLCVRTLKGPLLDQRASFFCTYCGSEPEPDAKCVYPRIKLQVAVCQSVYVRFQPDFLDVCVQQK